MREPKEFVGEVEDGEVGDEEKAEAEEKAEVEAETKDFGDDDEPQEPVPNDEEYKP
jgi:hypothetical protein